jgi:hypothetical protein
VSALISKRLTSHTLRLWTPPGLILPSWRLRLKRSYQSRQGVDCPVGLHRLSPFQMTLRSHQRTTPLLGPPLENVGSRSLLAIVSLIIFVAMVCRVCMGGVKRSAVICDKCNLITHSKCAHEAPPTCDLRSQLLLYAEQGSPAGVSLDGLNGLHPPRSSTTVPSEISFVTPSPRQSLDVTSSSPGRSPSPIAPTAYKFMNAFKRSRSSLSTENRPPNSASPSPNPPPPTHEEVTPKRKLSRPQPNMSSRERLHSLSSNGTAPNAASMRTADSQSSRQEPGRKSYLSMVEPDPDPTSQPPPVPEKNPISTHVMTATINHHMETSSRCIPGTLPNETDRHKKRAEKSSGCTVQ